MIETDVMLGDLVWSVVDDKPSKIFRINNISERGLIGDEFNTNFKPILLTREILIDNNFSVVGNSLVLSSLMELREESGLWWWVVKGECVLCLKYVHELQHLFRLRYLDEFEFGGDMLHVGEQCLAVRAACS